MIYKTLRDSYEKEYGTFIDKFFFEDLAFLELIIISPFYCLFSLTNTSNEWISAMINVFFFGCSTKINNFIIIHRSLLKIAFYSSSFFYKFLLPLSLELFPPSPPNSLNLLCNNKAFSRLSKNATFSFSFLKINLKGNPDWRSMCGFPSFPNLGVSANSKSLNSSSSSEKFKLKSDLSSSSS